MNRGIHGLDSFQAGFHAQLARLSIGMQPISQRSKLSWRRRRAQSGRNAGQKQTPAVQWVSSDHRRDISNSKGLQEGRLYDVGMSFRLLAFAVLSSALLPAQTAAPF